MILDCCFSGGFWGGCDQGDLEKVPNISLGCSTREEWYSPPSSEWARTLIAGAMKGADGIAPADWMRTDGEITLKEWYLWAQYNLPWDTVCTNHRKAESPDEKDCPVPDDTCLFLDSVWCTTIGATYYGDVDAQTVVFYDTFRCTETIHKTEPYRAIGLLVYYTGTGGTIRNVVVTSNPPGCDSPSIGSGHNIRFTWPDYCVYEGDVVEYEFTVNFPCWMVQPPDSIKWIYPELGHPTLSQWVLIILALSVAGFFVWQLKRKRAVISHQ